MQKPRGRPIRKGQVLNPKGRPVGARNIKTIIEEMLEAITTNVTLPDGTKKKLGGKEALIMVQIRQALKGDMRALSDLENRLEGMPIQATRNLGDEKKLRITFDRGSLAPEPLPTEEGSDGKPEAAEEKVEGDGTTAG